MTRLAFLAFTNDHEYIGQINPVESTTRLLWNDSSVCRFTIDDDDAMLQQLVPGESRVQVRFDGVRRMEGQVSERAGSGPKGRVTHTVLDDFSILDDITGWPVPTAGLDGQNVEQATYAGKLETAAFAAIAANVARLGLPITVPASMGRGADVSVDFRFHTLYEKLVPLLKAQRYALQLVREGESFAVSFSEGVEFARPLTLSSGIIDAYSWGQKRATRTRTIAGGQGQGTERQFARFIDTALEARQGIREGFKDSRATEDASYLPGQAEADTREKGPTASITAALSETSWFQFAKTYDLGDVVPVDLGFLQLTDVISEVELKETGADGLTITPKVGLLDSSPDARVYDMLRRLRGATRDQEKR